MTTSGKTTATARLGSALLALAAALALAFLMLPILVIVPLSFNAGRYLGFPLEGLSLRWYADFFGSPVWRGALGNSLVIALATTALATVLGTAAALGLARPGLPGRRLMQGLVLAPLIAPAVIVGVGMYFVFSTLQLTHTLPGLVLAHTALAVPFVVVTVGAAHAGLDARLLRAAASMGAPPWLAFRKITLPLIAPGVASGALFAFTTSLDEIVVTLFLAGPGQRTLPREMFSAAREALTPTIAAAATVLIAFSSALLAAFLFFRRRGG